MKITRVINVAALMSSKPEDVEKREKLGIKGRDDS
jgi:hypothetical protein